MENVVKTKFLMKYLNVIQSVNEFVLNKSFLSEILSVLLLDNQMSQ